MQTRRTFLSRVAATGVGLTVGPWIRTAKGADKLNLAVIGVANRGAANLAGVDGQNIVALCDVDPAHAGKAREKYPQASFFTDYRKLFDSMANRIDGVVVSTPDHTHAHPTLIALKLGKHVYCEKPLCHSVAEVRAVRTAARANPKLATQMGTQIHAGDNYRRVVEIVQSGVLGAITDVHVWNSSRPVAGTRVAGKPSAGFDLDVWTGPAPVDFFEVQTAKSGWNFAWPHFHWRWWWEFGGGTLADLGCHYIDLPFWALNLTAPTRVAAYGSKTYAGDNTVPDVLQVDYAFPQVGERGPVNLSWYHGAVGPSLTGGRTFKGFGSAVLFVGTKAQLVADYSKYQIFPDAFARDVKLPTPSLEKSVGHHQEWILAATGGGKTLCHFDYSGALTEAVLLGNVAYRTGSVVQWDSETATVTNNKQAAAFLGRESRKGWTV